jgi:dTDP-glucose pyrophosphorylase
MTTEPAVKQIIVRPETSIEDTLKVIEAGGLRIALVIGEDGRLLGTLSDGDVRRALIARMPLSAPVSEVMNRNPRVAHESLSRDSVLHMMEEHDVLVVPVVDAGGRLVRVHNLKELLEPQGKDNAVFLMAGGFGTRLRPLTDEIPKPMLKLGKKPILENTLESFVAAGFRRFYISVHYLAETIKAHFGNGEKWGVDIRYIEEGEPLGTAGALGLLPPIGDLPMIMMNGDLVTRVDFRALLAFHVENRSMLTMCVRECDVQVPYGVVQATGHQVEGIIEKPIHKFLVNAGIYVLAPEAIARVPKESRMDMPDLVRDIISAGREVNMFPIHEYWLDIGQFEDFNRALGEATWAV